MKVTKLTPRKNYHNSGRYPFPVFYLKYDISCRCLKHKIYITAPLRVQQVNAIYKFVAMVYYYNYRNSGHYPSSSLLFKT
jgi:hypothetical protein